MKKRVSFEDFEEVLERPITKFGNSSHIILPQKHAKKEAIIIIRPAKR